MKVTKKALEFIRLWEDIKKNGHPEWVAVLNEDGKPILKRRRNQIFKIGG
jgi:hypothetical protein